MVRPLEGVQEQVSRSWPSISIAMQQRELPEGWDKDLPAFPADAKGLASRETRPPRCSTRSPRTSPG